MTTTTLLRDAFLNGNGLAERNREEEVIARVGDAIAEAATQTRAEVEEDPVAAARRAAIDIAAATLHASSTETAAHSDDVDVISEGIARRLGLSGRALEDVLVTARLHDIGKVGVPLQIIDKPGPLTEDEWNVIRRHTVIGEQILLAVPELRSAALLVRCSHERWDGMGYPDGLAGEEIPLGSRIVFCADAYHAIRSDRAYRAGRPAAEALAEIHACAGTQFDPDVVEALQGVASELRVARNGVRPRTHRGRRLMALMLIVSVGATGSALARSGLIPNAKGSQKAPNTFAAPGAALGAAQPGEPTTTSEGEIVLPVAGAGQAALLRAGLLSSMPAGLDASALLPAVPGLAGPGVVGGPMALPAPAEAKGSRGVRDHGKGLGRGKGHGKGKALAGKHPKAKEKAIQGKHKGKPEHGEGAGSDRGAHRNAAGHPKPQVRSAPATPAHNPSAGAKTKGGSAPGPSTGGGASQAGQSSGAPSKAPAAPKTPSPAPPPSGSANPPAPSTPPSPGGGATERSSGSQGSSSSSSAGQG